MFKTMTTNPQTPPGKKADHRSLDGKSTHFSLGDSKMGEEKSQTAIAFGANATHKIEKTKPVEKHKSQVMMGDTPTGYVTNNKAAFTGMPKNFVRARPLREKQDLVKTNYSVSLLNVYDTAIVRRNSN